MRNPMTTQRGIGLVHLADQSGVCYEGSGRISGFKARCARLGGAGTAARGQQRREEQLSRSACPSSRGLAGQRYWRRISLKRLRGCPEHGRRKQ